MARTAGSKNRTTIQKEVFNTPDQVDLALRITEQFAQSLGIYPQVISPYMVNQRMKDASLTSVGEITSDMVSKALAKPKDSEKQLLGISETFEYTSTPYKRLIHYMADILSWDFTYYTKNRIKDSSEYKSKAYQDDLWIMQDFLNKFDVKKEFNTALNQLYREESFFCVLRDEDPLKYTLQQLPSEYCLIDGRWPYGLLYSFNYYYFAQGGGVSLDAFPSIFKRTFNQLFLDKKTPDTYEPFMNIDIRNLSSYVYWADCSPKNGFWGFKLQPQITTRTPYFSGLFPDLANQNLIRNLQKSAYVAQAIKLLSGQVGLLNRDTKTALANNFTMTPEVMGKFLQLMKSALNSDAVNVVTAPLEDMKAIEYTGNNDMYSSYLRSTLGSSGANSNLLYSGGDFKMNSVETLLSLSTDELAAQEIYPFFANFLEYQINNRTKKYKFGIIFEGSNFYPDRDRRLKQQMDMANIGIVNPQKIFAALGQNPFIAQQQLDEARAMGWTDKLTPIVSAFQQSGASGKTGRPTKSESDLTDSGQETRDAGSNIEKE